MDPPRPMKKMSVGINLSSSIILANRLASLDTLFIEERRKKWRLNQENRGLCTCFFLPFLTTIIRFPTFTIAPIIAASAVSIAAIAAIHSGPIMNNDIIIANMNNKKSKGKLSKLVEYVNYVI